MKSAVLGSISAVIAMVAVGSANAMSIDCSDAMSTLHYSNYSQEGGACCGRSSTSLTYLNQVLKETMTINDGPAGGGSYTDSDPTLIVTPGKEIDLNNDGSNQQTSVRRYAMNLVLHRTNKKAVLPGGSKSRLVISVVCEEKRSKNPPP